MSDFIINTDNDKWFDMLSKGTTIFHAIHVRSIGHKGFYLYKGTFSTDTALRVVRNDEDERWEVFEPGDDEPLKTDKSLQNCIHYCVAIL